MCIIVAKDKNVELPTIDILKRCFDYNSDGAGFMYVDKGQVIVDKGYLDWKSFNNRFTTLCKKYDDFKGKALVMHFRIGTSGKNDKGNTHPYIISDNYKDLHKIKISGSLGMAHNGVIHDYTPDINDKRNINDTQNFIMLYVYPLYKHWKDFYKNEYMRKGLEDISGSKLVFLDTREDIYYIGDFKEDKGVKYSNDTYKKTTYGYGGTGKGYYNSWRDWEDYDYSYDTMDYPPVKKDIYNNVEYKVFDKNKEETTWELPSSWFYFDGETISRCGDNLWLDEEDLSLWRKSDKDYEWVHVMDNTEIYDDLGNIIY